MTTASRIWKQLFLRKTCIWQEIQFVSYKENKAKNHVVLRRGSPWLIAFKKVHFNVKFFGFFFFWSQLSVSVSLHHLTLKETGAQSIPVPLSQRSSCRRTSLHLLVVGGKPLRNAVVYHLLFAPLWVSMKTLGAEKENSNSSWAFVLENKSFFLHFFRMISPTPKGKRKKRPVDFTHWTPRWKPVSWDE